VGTVVIDRFAYHRRGQANLHPADGVRNLPVERYSHGLRQLATAESARGSFHEACDAIARATGVEVGNHQVEQLVQASAVDFDAFRAAQERPLAQHGRWWSRPRRQRASSCAPTPCAHPP
jgi:hypothetical protein